MKISFASLSLCPLLVVSTSVWSAGSITDIGGLNTNSLSYAGDVSANGLYVVGYSSSSRFTLDTTAFIWSAVSGMESLGFLNGGSSSLASGMSRDGTVVVGRATDGSIGNASRAFRWTRSSGMVSLGTLNGGNASGAKAASADGSVIVGDSEDGSVGGHRRAFRWTSSAGMVSLGLIAGGGVDINLASQATAVSADGTVVTGWSSDSPSSYMAFRWTQSAGMVSLGTLPGGWVASEAEGISADGLTIVGAAEGFEGRASEQAFRWTQAFGMVSLGTLNGGTDSDAFAVSSNGSVIVGEANDGAAGNAQRGFRWTQSSGMQTVEDWLRSTGANVGSITTSYASGVSADGSVVVGGLSNGHAYIARAKSGLQTLAEVQRSLIAGGHSSKMAISAIGLVLNGAHSRPLSHRVAAGKKAFWVAGDWGTDDHGSRDGSLGLAEVGVGYNYGPAQLNIAVGQNWAKQNFDLDGHAKTDGTYLLAEGLIPVSGNLWATVSGYGHWGDSDLKRGYINAGLPDSSKGTPDITTWGVRGRLDWENVFSLAATDFTPYADLIYTEAKMERYTETGGGFPARFDSREDKATEMRLGLNLSHPIDNANLFGIAEAVHRFERSGARTSGELIGLTGFDLPGEDYKRDWIRVGAGIEGKVAEGVASLSINATTRGEATNMWLAASYRLAF